MSRGPRWTEAELEKMFRMRARGCAFDEISAEIGTRTTSACMSTYYVEIGRRRALAGIAPNRRPRHTPPPPPPVTSPAPSPAPPPSPPIEIRGDRSSASTVMLSVDAELRARIAERGITGGLLGDPMPGRSALDKKLRGET